MKVGSGARLLPPHNADPVDPLDPVDRDLCSKVGFRLDETLFWVKQSAPARDAPALAPYF